MTTCPNVTEKTSELTQKVVQANKDHQYALKVYTERLEAELEAVDKLLTAAEQSDEEPDVDAGGLAIIPESIKPIGPFPPDIILEGSLFEQEAEHRQQYLRYTVIHPMKMSELEALSDAVKAEIQRAHAHESQQIGQQVSMSNFTGEIDWNRVAARVSFSDVQRSASECEIRWRGSSSSQWNQNAWAQSELTRLRELVGNVQEGEVDWVEISRKLGTGRMPIDCMRHAITRRTHVWTPEADARLLEAIRIYGTANWMLARTVSDDATASQCQSRYMRSLDPSLVRGAWTEKEDSQLSRAVEVYGRSWSDVCNYVEGRSNEQCRDRWQDFLDPTVTRANWNEAEDRMLLNAIEHVGEGRWKDISRFMKNGRTDSMCRSRYATLMKRKLKTANTSLSPTPSDIAGTLSGITTPASASSDQHLPTTFQNEIVQGTIKTHVTGLNKPKRKPRGKTGVQQDSTTTLTEQTDPPSTTANKAVPRKSYLATSSVTEKLSADSIAEDASVPGTVQDESQRGKKRTVQFSPQNTAAKKRKAAESKKREEPVYSSAETQDRGEALPDASISASKEKVKRPRPPPRMVTKRNAVDVSQALSTPTAVIVHTHTTPHEVAPSILKEGTVSTKEADGPSQASTSSATAKSVPLSKSKSAHACRKPPAAAPARKSARLAGRSGGPALNTDVELPIEPEPSTDQDRRSH